MSGSAYVRLAVIALLQCLGAAVVLMPLKGCTSLDMALNCNPKWQGQLDAPECREWRDARNRREHLL